MYYMHLIIFIFIVVGFIIYWLSTNLGEITQKYPAFGKLLSKWLYDKDMSESMLKSWTLVLLGLAISWGVDAMIEANWWALFSVIVFILMIFLILYYIDKSSINKKKTSDRKLIEDIKNTINKSINESSTETTKRLMEIQEELARLNKIKRISENMVEPIEKPNQIRKDGKVKPMGEAKHRSAKQVGVTKKEFHTILDRASQPVKSEAQSDSEKSET